MKRFVKGLMKAVVAGIAALGVLAPATATADTGSTLVKWSAQSVLTVALTPNYYAGFGAVKAVIGTQPTPTHGPNATLDSGAVDFGGVLGGTTYLYKYAAHLSVTSNDPNGFYVYGEGAADFYNTADASTQSLSTVLYYLNSTSGSPADGNTGFSPGLPFYKTNGMVANNGQFTTPSITYISYPAPIATSPTQNGNFYYDYELKVPPAATAGLNYVWIVYTVVAR